MDLLADLDARGLVHDVTDRSALTARLADGPVGVYAGFDPTADSLHAGHLIGQLMLRRVQIAGHRPFPLAGGATGMVGDPGGRSEERNLLDRDTLRHNVASIKRQLERLMDFEPGPTQAVLVDNADWTESMPVLTFLRDVGKHVTVNQMLAKESVRARVASEHGISYTEFSYMLLQANDFFHLFREHGVEVQMGGSDQWGNITAGIDLIRRRVGGTVHGLTWPLLTLGDGQKMGKSVSGALWLDPAKTSPYEFWQYWMQVPDADVATLLLRLTFRSVDDIHALVAAHEAAPHRREAQRILANDVTGIVHGPDAASAAAGAAAVLFGGDPTAAGRGVLDTLAQEVPTSRHSPDALQDVVALLVGTGLAASRGEARRLLGQRSVRANGVVVDPDAPAIAGPLLAGRYVLLRRGKTHYHLAEFSAGGVDRPEGQR